MTHDPNAEARAISVIVVTYNHARWIEQCLESIDAQTFSDFEVVIIDDSSTDRTVELVERWLEHTPSTARLVVNPQNVGLTTNLNRALRTSRGEYVSYVSGDDWYEPEKLARQHQLLADADGSVAVVFSDAWTADETGTRTGRWYDGGLTASEGRVFDVLVAENFICAPTPLVRRSAIEAVGSWDETLVFEDYDMWLRLADQFEFRFLPECLVTHRVHPTSLSQDPARDVDMRETEAALLLKWVGHSPEHDQALLRRAWLHGLRMLPDAPARVRGVLRAVCDAQPTSLRRGVLALSSVPGFPRVFGELVAVRDRRVHADHPTGDV